MRARCIGEDVDAGLVRRVLTGLLCLASKWGEALQMEPWGVLGGGETS